jgi:hypothetical protein
MFNTTLIVIEAFIRELRMMYERTYGTLEPGYPGVISFVAQLALENIATSDAAYHDVNHTIMVTLVGQEILRGRHISVGGVTPRDWLLAADVTRTAGDKYRCHQGFTYYERKLLGNNFLLGRFSVFCSNSVIDSTFRGGNSPLLWNRELRSRNRELFHQLGGTIKPIKLWASVGAGSC